MAYEIPGQKLGVEVAGADLSAKQYTFINCDASGIVSATAAARAIGVLQNKPTTGQACEIMVTGVSKVLAGAAIAKGALIEIDASQRAVTRTAGIVVGQALTATTAAGEFASVLLLLNA